MAVIHLRSYGKINLCLDVTGVREDGYHQLETIMQRISLYDRIRLEWDSQARSQDKDGGQAVAIQVRTSKPYLPTDERNLAYKAAKLMIERYGGQRQGSISISIIKNVPVSAGLAGGSGNGAAVLIGLNRLWNLGLTTRQLCRLGEELGADVPFCVLSQNTRYDCAYATGRGEVLRPLRQGMKKHLVLAKPAFGVSTKEVFRQIDNVTIKERPDCKALITGLKEQEEQLIYPNMINVLELYTLKKYEAVSRLKKLFIEETAAGKVLMSGSGPTVFGVYDTQQDAKIACEIIRKLKYEAYWASTTKR